MQLARIATSDTTGFVVRAQESDDWISLKHMGIQASTTREVIEQWGSVRAAVRSYSAEGDGDGTLRCPVVAPGKVLGVGLNYIDHIKETGATQPPKPLIFAKYSSSLAGPGDEILYDPSLSTEVDYESELAVIIGRKSRRLEARNALSSVFGYAVANDVSARDVQHSESQASRSKSLDTFCPLGPWITTADAVQDPQNLRIGATVNETVRQDSNTSQMLFSVKDLLVFLSSTMTLWPGDVILTGTPPGVGSGFVPPKFLRPGDTVECSIEKLGTIRNTVIADPDAGTTGNQPFRNIGGASSG